MKAIFEAEGELRKRRQKGARSFSYPSITGKDGDGQRTRFQIRDVLILLLLTLGALLVHGYHPFAEDGELYLPAVEKLLHPELFPFNAQFFEYHAHSTLFPNLVATSVRVSHLPFEDVLFFWHIATIFLFLVACWELSGRCFSDRKARWAGVVMIAALLTVPVAGTALYILDQYVNPRNLVAFATVLSIVKVLDRKYVQAGLLLVFTAVIHPLMSLFALSFCAVVVVLNRLALRSAALAVLPFGLTFRPPPSAYHIAAQKFTYFYITRWQWYEWLGALAPLAIVWWFSRIGRARRLETLDVLCRALIIYELIYFLQALVLSSFARFESLARLQPMRCLYLLYIFMFLFAGGLLADHLLKNYLWRWVMLFVALGGGMYVAQRMLFPASAHIEWPGAAQENQWAQAFEWIRSNTPNNAIFALDPQHMEIPGEDHQGFRAIAQRSMLADEHDSGAVSMFPVIAEEWLRQVQAQDGWKHFQLRDFHRLQAKYGVNWVVLQQPGVTGFDCPYHNQAVLVCRLTDR